MELLLPEFIMSRSPQNIRIVPDLDAWDFQAASFFPAALDDIAGIRICDRKRWSSDAADHGRNAAEAGMDPGAAS